MWYLVEYEICDNRTFYLRERFITKNPEKYKDKRGKEIGYEYRYIVTKINIK